MRCLNESISFATPCLVAAATFIVRVHTGGTLTPTSVFTTVSLFALLQVSQCRVVAALLVPRVVLDTFSDWCVDAVLTLIWCRTTRSTS